MKSRIAIPLLLFYALVLASCGQKGPLYLPDKSVQPAETEQSDSPDT